MRHAGPGDSDGDTPGSYRYGDHKVEDGGFLYIEEDASPTECHPGEDDDNPDGAALNKVLVKYAKPAKVPYL
jgi:hypothetical protein